MESSLLITALILVGLIVIVFFFFSKPQLAPTFSDISQDDFIARQQSKGEYLLLDVRTAEEFAKGHIEGAFNISHLDISKRLTEIPRDKELIIYCRSGKRVIVAANELSKNGYKQLLHLQGDMLEWNKNSHPISYN